MENFNSTTDNGGADSSTSHWYTPLTQVTPVSKYLAILLFILIPIYSFFFGVHYERTTATSFNDNHVNKVVMPSTSKTSEIDDLSNENLSPSTSTSYSPLQENEIFHFQYNFEDSDNCTVEKKYLDCINSTGLLSGYRLPSEFDPRAEDSLFIDFCNFGGAVGERVDWIYCNADYRKVNNGREVTEEGLIVSNYDTEQYSCTFAIERLEKNVYPGNQIVLSGEIKSPKCIEGSNF